MEAQSHSSTSIATGEMEENNSSTSMMTDGTDHSSTSMTTGGIDVMSPEGLQTVREIFEAQNISPDVPPNPNLESVWLSGGLYTFLQTSEDTNGEYTVFDFYVPSQAGPPAHVHMRENEAFYVLDGQVSFQVGTETFVGGPGTLVPYHKGGLHAFKNLGTEPARMLVLATPSGIENLFREGGQPGTDLSTPPPEDVPRFLAAASKYGVEPYPEATLLGRSAIEDGGTTFIGNESDETLIGTDGSDIILGRTGNDQLDGGSGNDIMYGGTEDDILQGGIGQNTLSGGDGKDMFMLSAIAGTDTITDFTDAQDLFMLEEGLSFNDLAIVQGTDTNVSNTLIKLANSDQLLATLSGIEANTITDADFCYC